MATETVRDATNKCLSLEGCKFVGTHFSSGTRHSGARLFLFSSDDWFAASSEVASQAVTLLHSQMCARFVLYTFQEPSVL